MKTEQFHGFFNKNKDICFHPDKHKSIAFIGKSSCKLNFIQPLTSRNFIFVFDNLAPINLRGKEYKYVDLQKYKIDLFCHCPQSNEQYEIDNFLDILMNKLKIILGKNLFKKCGNSIRSKSLDFILSKIEKNNNNFFDFLNNEDIILSYKKEFLLRFGSLFESHLDFETDSSKMIFYNFETANELVKVHIVEKISISRNKSIVVENSLGLESYESEIKNNLSVSNICFRELIRNNNAFSGDVQILNFIDNSKLAEIYSKKESDSMFKKSFQSIILLDEKSKKQSQINLVNLNYKKSLNNKFNIKNRQVFYHFFHLLIDYYFKESWTDLVKVILIQKEYRDITNTSNLSTLINAKNSEFASFSAVNSNSQKVLVYSLFQKNLTQFDIDNAESLKDEFDCEKVLFINNKLNTLKFSENQLILDAQSFFKNPEKEDIVQTCPSIIHENFTHNFLLIQKAGTNITLMGEIE